LDVITLRYCSTKGLCKVGILPDLPYSTEFSKRTLPGKVDPPPTKKLRWKTIMEKICDEQTPDGNVPSRNVEVLVLEDDAEDGDED